MYAQPISKNKRITYAVAHVPPQFWTHEWETPQEWLEALTALKAQSFVRRIFMLGIPTARVDPKRPHYVEVCSREISLFREHASSWHGWFMRAVTEDGLPVPWCCSARHSPEHPSASARQADLPCIPAILWRSRPMPHKCH